MANEQNLNPFGTLTESEQREISSKGGIASGEARRNKKLLRECLEILLEKDYTDKHGNTMSGAEAIALKQLEKALKGDTKAFEVVRDTVGQKPVEKVAVGATDEAKNELAELLEQRRNAGK